MGDNISKYRSDVIEKFINIESLINGIISQRYFKKMIKEFLFEVLYDPYCSFALKRNILMKIAPYFSKFQNLNRLNNIRNYFAHCNQELFDNPPDFSQKGKILDPKNTEKELNFENLYKEFMEEEKGVVSELVKIYLSLGGELYKEDQIPRP